LTIKGKALRYNIWGLIFYV